VRWVEELAERPAYPGGLSRTRKTGDGERFFERKKVSRAERLPAIDFRPVVAFGETEGDVNLEIVEFLAMELSFILGRSLVGDGLVFVVFLQALAVFSTDVVN
jgi:hypothetical protein